MSGASESASGASRRPADGDERPDGSALVTGASRGIGAAIARGLAADGWPVGVNYRADREGAERVVGDIEAAGGRAVALQADVAGTEAAEHLVGELEQRFGTVLALVNNAGVSVDALSVQIGDEDWNRVLETNLSGAFRITRRALPPMIRVRFGRVINIASVVGPRANPGQASYAASKAGLLAFTRTVAAEVARRGVTVNAIAPGLIETEQFQERFRAWGAAKGASEALRTAVPARRAGTPEEVATCARFLASTEASYVTGATLFVDGGLTA